MTDLSLNILLTASDTSMSSAVTAAGNVIKNLASGNVLGAVAVAAAAAGAALVGIGTVSVQAAADFQASTTKIASYAGLSGKALDQMKQSLLDMSTQVGQSPKALADALYPIVSAGYQASDALNILKLSAQTAAASGADTTTVADGLTTVLKAFNFPAKDAGAVMDVLNQSVANAKTTFPELSKVIGKLSLSANSAHVPFVDMNAALDVLTTHGFPSVAQASNSLGNLFTQVGVKTDALQKHAQQLGLQGFDAAKFSAMNLTDKIDYLNKATGGNQAEILKMLGGSTLALKAFNALSGGAKDYKTDLDLLNNSQGKTAAVFKNASDTYNFHMQQMGAAFDKVKIAIGDQLLPILSRFMGWLTPIVTGFADWFTKSNVLQNSIQTLGTWINNTGNFLKPLVPVIQNVVGWFGQMFNSIGSNQTLWTTLWNALQQIGQFLQTTFQPVWQQLVDTFNTQLKPAWTDFMTQIKPMMPMLQQLGQIIGGVLVADFIFWIGVIGGTLGALAGFWAGAIRAIGGIVQFISGAIQTVMGIVAFFHDFVTGDWDKLGSDLGVIWGGIVRMVQGAWNVIAGISEAGVNMIIGFLNGFTQAALGPINALLNAAHQAPITIGKIPTLHISTQVGGAATFQPYQAPATTKTATSAAQSTVQSAVAKAQQQAAQAQLDAAKAQVQAWTDQRKQQIALTNQQQAAQQQQQQNMSQILASTNTPTTNAVAAASNTATAQSLKQQQAAQVAAMKLADTQSKAIATSGSSQVQALVDASKQAAAQGNTSLAAYDAGKAATLANQQKAAATKAANAAKTAAKAAASLAAKAAKASASQKKHAQVLADAAARHAATLAAQATKLAQNASNHKALVATIQQSTTQLTSQQCPGDTGALPSALGVALPDYATGTGYAQNAPVVQQAPAQSTGTVHHHYHVTIQTDSKDPQQHGKQAADEIQKRMAKALRGQGNAPRYTSGGSH